MKLLWSCIAFGTIFAVGRVQFAEGLEDIVGDDDWVLLSNHAGGSPNNCDDYNFCATVKNGKMNPGTSVVLDTCENWNPEEGWRTWTTPDGKGFLLMLGNTHGYSKDKKAVCMQAGTGKRDLGSRSRIRLAPCDIDSPLQRFIWKDYDEACGDKEGGKLKLQSRRDLCLTWAGADADDIKPGQTSVIVMPCEQAKRERAKGWFVR